MDRSDICRRGFVKTCGAAAFAAAASGRLVEPSFALADAPGLKLVDKAGKPIKAGTLEVDANYVFSYPYNSTPCLLLRLDAATPRNIERTDAEKAPYTWPGGVGKDGAVVAYSAICAHLLSYDSKHASFLTYHKARTKLSEHERAITCCAHATTYDPANGANVMSGPAEFPLAAVQLEHHGDSDELTAVGLIGTVLFDKFFDAYRADLNAEFGRGAYKELLQHQTIVLPIAEYSQAVASC
jgi:arsenite oxidase small subunit